MLETEDRPSDEHPVAPTRSAPGRWLLAAAAAAVVVTMVGALLVVGGDDEELGTVTAPPTTVSGDSLPVGPHVMVSMVGLNEDRVAVTIPASGWFAAPDEGSLLKDLGGDNRVTVATVPGDHYRVPEDICRWQAGELVPSNDASTRAHGLLSLLREQTYDTPEGSRTRELSTPVDISINGDSGRSVTGLLPDIDPSGCDEQRFCSLLDRDGARCLLPHFEPNALVRLWSVDVPNRNPSPWVVAATYQPTTSPELLAEMSAIVDSMTEHHR